MFHLRFLGGASIETSAGPLAGAAAQRRRLALPAQLAASPRGAMSRDKLAAHVSAEVDAARASRAISDAAHALRKALGRDAIVSVGDELRLDPALVTSDIAMFAQRLPAGDAASGESGSSPFERPQRARWRSARVLVLSGVVVPVAVVRFWKDADPALRPLVAQARGALARLAVDHASS